MRPHVSPISSKGRLTAPETHATSVARDSGLADAGSCSWVVNQVRSQEAAALLPFAAASGPGPVLGAGSPRLKGRDEEVVRYEEHRPGQRRQRDPSRPVVRCKEMPRFPLRPLRMAPLCDQFHKSDYPWLPSSPYLPTIFTAEGGQITRKSPILLWSRPGLEARTHKM